MQRAIVMTVIGPDRPGLVEAVASLVAEHGGNWLESRMSRLGGQFAGILRVELADSAVSELTAALEGLETRGLAVVVQADPTGRVDSAAKLSVLEIVGQDRPGIVRQISGALAGYGVNVEELHTECCSGAMSGETIFRARAKLSLPPGCDSSEVRRRLEKIAEDLIVEISLEDVADAGQGSVGNPRASAV
jgi:glycine cleavage system regulatory protein